MDVELKMKRELFVQPVYSIHPFLRIERGKVVRKELLCELEVFSIVSLANCSRVFFIKYLVPQIFRTGVIVFITEKIRNDLVVRRAPLTYVLCDNAIEGVVSQHD